MLMSVLQNAVKKCVGQPKWDQNGYLVLTMPLLKTNKLLKKKQSWKRLKRKEIKEDSWERLWVRDVTSNWNRQWGKNRLAEVELSEKVDTLGSKTERQRYWIRQILSKSNSRGRAWSRGRDQQSEPRKSTMTTADIFNVWPAAPAAAVWLRAAAASVEGPEQERRPTMQHLAISQCAAAHQNNVEAIRGNCSLMAPFPLSFF